MPSGFPTVSWASDVASSISAAQDNAQAAAQRLRKAEGAVTEAITEGRVAERSLAEATKKLNQVAGAPLLAKVETEAAALKANRAKLVIERERTTRLVKREGLVREQAAAEGRRRTAEKDLKAGFPAGIPKDLAGAIAQRRRELQGARESEAAAQKKAEQARDTHEKVAASRAKFERQGTDLKHRSSTNMRRAPLTFLRHCGR